MASSCWARPLGMRSNQLTQDRLFGLYTGALLTSGIANSISARFLDWMTVFCAWFCLLAIAVIVIVVPCVAPTHQKASWVFSAWIPTYGEWYLQDKYTAAYSAIMALLMPAYNCAFCVLCRCGQRLVCGADKCALRT